MLNAYAWDRDVILNGSSFVSKSDGKTRIRINSVNIPEPSKVSQGIPAVTSVVTTSEPAIEHKNDPQSSEIPRFASVNQCVKRTQSEPYFDVHGPVCKKQKPGDKIFSDILA